jgi:hypothetical protein
MVRRSPTGACQCSRILASPRIRGQQAWHLDVVQQVVQPRQRKQLVAAARPAAIDPQQVTPDVITAKPWAVWLWRLKSYSTFWLAHPHGRCTRVASPTTQTASPAAAISTSTSRRSSRVVKGAVGLAEPHRGKLAKQQVQAVAHLGLGDADHAASAPVRQPVQQHRGDRVQADLHESDGVPSWPDGRDGSR